MDERHPRGFGETLRERRWKKIYFTHRRIIFMAVKIPQVSLLKLQDYTTLFSLPSTPCVPLFTHNRRRETPKWLKRGMV